MPVAWSLIYLPNSNGAFLVIACAGVNRSAIAASERASARRSGAGTDASAAMS